MIDGNSAYRMHEFFDLAKSTNAVDCDVTKLLKNDKLLFLNSMLMRFDQVLDSRKLMASGRRNRARGREGSECS